MDALDFLHAYMLTFFIFFMSPETGLTLMPLPLLLTNQILGVGQSVKLCFHSEEIGSWNCYAR